MNHPYSESYVDEIVETQGRLFERLQDDWPTRDGFAFVKAYMASSTRAALDQGDAYLANLDSAALKEYFVSTESYQAKDGSPMTGFAPNWIGQFYARYQWQYDVKSAELVNAISPEWLVAAYPGLHDLDLAAAVSKVSGSLGVKS